jgi:hypothetical protein
MIDYANIIQVAIISILMVTLTSIIFYEIMYISWSRIDNLKFPHRFKMFIVIIAIFLAHTIAIWLYGLVYYLMARYELGDFIIVNSGLEEHRFIEHVYFSAVTYSSLGFGDVVPKREIRLLTGVEVLNGLVLIAWSASYTYLSMEKYWKHRKGEK